MNFFEIFVNKTRIPAISRKCDVRGGRTTPSAALSGAASSPPAGTVPPSADASADAGDRRRLSGMQRNSTGIDDSSIERSMSFSA